jgi:hypothetical protein
MCRQEDLIRTALDEAVDECSFWLIERELLLRSGDTEAHERADMLTKRLKLLCATLQELLILHLTEHGCGCTPSAGCHFETSN